jgi:hypothetical protein
MPSINSASSDKLVNYKNAIEMYERHHLDVGLKLHQCRKFKNLSDIKTNSVAAQQTLTNINKCEPKLKELENICIRDITATKDYYNDSFVGRIMLFLSFIFVFEPKLSAIEADLARISLARQELETVKTTCKATLAKEQPIKDLIQKCEEFSKLPKSQRDVGRHSNLLNKLKEFQSTYPNAKKELEEMYTEIEKWEVALIEDIDALLTIKG